jgi:hypothetical protein
MHNNKNLEVKTYIFQTNILHSPADINISQSFHPSVLHFDILRSSNGSMSIYSYANSYICRSYGVVRKITSYLKSWQTLCGQLAEN